MIRDSRGKVPNFVFDDDTMTHQPSGKTVPLKSKSDADLRSAHQRLMRA